MTYTIFLRSATSFEEFSTAQKTIVERGLSLEQAREACRRFNCNRSVAQIKANTKMEFTSGEVH